MSFWQSRIFVSICISIKLDLAILVIKNIDWNISIMP